MFREFIRSYPLVLFTTCDIILMYPTESTPAALAIVNVSSQDNNNNRKQIVTLPIYNNTNKRLSVCRTLVN